MAAILFMYIDIDRAKSNGLDIHVEDNKLIINFVDGIPMKSMKTMQSELVDRFGFKPNKAANLMDDVHEVIYHQMIWNVLADIDESQP